MDTRAILPEDVRRIAHLARLTLTDEDVVRFGHDLAEILDYVARLELFELPDGAGAAIGAMPAAPLRGDEPRPTLPIEAVERNAPSMERRHFIVPQVVGP